MDLISFRLALVFCIATSTAAVGITPKIAGDDGNTTALTPGLSIRNLDTSLTIELAPNEEWFSASVTGPDGVGAASNLECTVVASNRSIGYRGNGTYTVTVQAFPKNDYTCKTPLGPPQTVQYAVNASVSLGPAPTTFALRDPNSVSTKELALPIALNPGASLYEVRYANGGVVASDGSISGPSSEGFVDKTSGTVPLRLGTPGTWVVVARARGNFGSGTYFTPWSAPIRVTVLAPFDLTSTSFTDSRGPKYQIKASVREPTASGVVQVAIASGSKGPFRVVASPKIAKGSVTFAFTLSKTGSYRLRYRFAGSPTVAAGEAIEKIRVTRSLIFR